MFTTGYEHQLQGYKGILFDLMMPKMRVERNHCSTCNCQSYDTYTGFSLKPNSVEMVEEIKNMNKSQREEFMKKNLDLVIEG